MTFFKEQKSNVLYDEGNELAPISDDAQNLTELLQHRSFGKRARATHALKNPVSMD
jgi:hypothetical protein